MVIPARNSALSIAGTVSAVLDQRVSGVTLDVVVVDDGSTDDTARLARAAGARIVSLPPSPGGGNPAAARNRGARMARGDPIVFLDADCTPRAGWLEALLRAHGRGEVCVGGSLDRPAGLSATARWDYYCGWYHVHPRRPAGPVANHPPGNLSVRRRAFQETPGFTERQPLAYAHEELAWQASLRRSGADIYFEPEAVVLHHNRPGLGNLLRRNYRWGYSAVESKTLYPSVRLAGLYRHPRLLVAGAIPLSLAQGLHIIGLWLRAGVAEPLFAFPLVMVARLAYGVGMMIGGLRWLRGRESPAQEHRPRWE